MSSRLTAKTLNGVGSFVHQCKRVTLRYSNWGGSSNGMRAFIKNNLKDIASQNPQIEFLVEQKSGHPLIRGDYVNGRDKVVCVRNLDPNEIMVKFNLTKNSSGAKLKTNNKPVESINESVRGIWSPFHIDPQFRHKV
ncbi:hypothetical protein NADFUDRAFT_39131 [Nadsonia fulvescens var. elongata DSM 6958]|uniref:Large ribosomal subunit protein mL43 n=1 Tax=Nadsonia fulvescens var. elongata DSM 6958 TaxID=857566 RepID=A0A1E3PQW9_9ASCO|nr:hypothetical protein NADFUDRAFT_39131 [Nadsonia fulvescens var. elongata DSM 6958]